VKSVKLTEPDESVPDVLHCGVEHLVGLCAMYLEPVTQVYFCGQKAGHCDANAPAMHAHCSRQRHIEHSVYHWLC
jgi:hypothetical protein